MKKFYSALLLGLVAAFTANADVKSICGSYDWHFRGQRDALTISGPRKVTITNPEGNKVRITGLLTDDEEQYGDDTADKAAIEGVYDDATKTITIAAGTMFINPDGTVFETSNWTEAIRPHAGVPNADKSAEETDENADFVLKVDNNIITMLNTAMYLRGYKPAAGTKHGVYENMRWIMAVRNDVTWEDYGEKDFVDGLWGNAQVARPNGVSTNWKVNVKKLPGNNVYAVSNTFPGYYEASDTIPAYRNPLIINATDAGNVWIAFCNTGIRKNSGVAPGLLLTASWMLKAPLYDVATSTIDASYNATLSNDVITFPAKSVMYCYPYDTYMPGTMWDSSAAVGTTLNVAVPASVSELEATNAPAEYYNLQGVKIANPAKGQIVIRRQGSKIAKVIF